MTSFIFSILHFSVPLQKFFHFTNTTHPWHPYSFKTPCFLLRFDHEMATLPLSYLSRLKSFPFWIYFLFLEHSSHHIQISAHIIQTQRGLHALSCWPKTTPSSHSLSNCLISFSSKPFHYLQLFWLLSFYFLFSPAFFLPFLNIDVLHNLTLSFFYLSILFIFPHCRM